MVASNDRGAAAASDADRMRDIERQLLGACLWSGTHQSYGLDEAAERVGPADFVIHAHGVVFQAMLALRAAGAPVDAGTVYVRLRDAGLAADLGGDPRLWIADTLTSQSGDFHAAQYADMVREASRGRRLRRAVHQMSGLVLSSPRPVADVRAECEQILFDAGDREVGSGPYSAEVVTREAMRRIDDLRDGTVPPGLATGFPDLDQVLCGIEAGDLVVIAARPSVGKTSLATAVALNAAAAGNPVVFFSLEMPRLNITQRVLAMRSGVPLTLIRLGRLKPDQVDRVAAAGDAFSAQPFFIEDASPMTTARIASTVRRGVRRHGLKLAVVDYLGLIEAENPGESKVQQVGLACKRLKEMAKNCGLPVIVLCQLNRACEDRPDGKPRLSDLRDSGEVEQHADTVILLSKEKNQDADADVWLVDANVAKSRNGLTTEVTLGYRPRVTRYENAPAGRG